MTPRDRRALIIGAAIAALAIVSLRLVPWVWQSVREQRVGLQGRAELVERMRAEIRGAGSLEDSAVVVKGRLAMLTPKLLAGGSAVEAAAALGTILAAAATRHRVRVSRVDPVSDTLDHRGVTRAALRAVLEGDTRGLLGTLDAVGRESVVVAVDSLRIAAADPFVPAGRAELLRTDLMVSGWFLAAGQGR